LISFTIMSDSTRLIPDEVSTVKSRLIKLLKEKRMSQTEFARLMGVSPTYIGAMRRSISEERLKKLLEIFPDLSRDWILFGEGEMFINQDEDEDLTEGYVVPLIPVKAFAGNLQMWASGVELRDCEKVVSPVKGVDFAIRIAGNSMEPEFQNGSILFIKRINQRAFIPWGNPMVIDTENGVLVKAVYPGNSDDEEGGYIEARSYNPNYPPFKIPVETIYNLYRIVSATKQYSTM
ncbi:MAG: helix-turn-helix domain-containing protein, partial [Muribaculaceae bacterium]|nr:helix-turn-helix domain-containing protein [Muribaculaceae bacterium]